MNKLEQLIKELCPNGVERKPLESLCTIITKQTGFDYSATIKPSLINEKREDTYSFIQNKDFNGLTINLDTDFYIPISVANRFPKITLDTPSILISLSGKVGNLGFYNLKKIAFIGGAVGICKLKPNVNGKYIMYFLQSKEGQRFLLGSVKAASHLNITVESIRKAPIPVPPIEVQAEIVKILDEYSTSVTALQQELEKELTARKKQYEYYRDLLLDFGVHGGATSECEWRTVTLLDMLCQPITDGPHTTPVFVDKGIPFVSVDSVWDGRIHFEKMRGYITEDFDLECCKKYKPQKHDVYMVKSGSTTGKVAYVDTDERFNIWSPLAAMRVNEDNSSRYLYHLLQTKRIQEMVKAKASHGSQPNLGMRELEKFEVTIPPLVEQLRIVSILDRFDKLCNDISEGLPAEIEARRKQYEYYRDKLLSFEEVKM